MAEQVLAHAAGSTCRKTAHAEAMIAVTMIRLMASLLAGEEVEPHGPIETEAACRLADDFKNQ
ncbi:hypothetical protein [Kitasatospora purpeofusca]